MKTVYSAILFCVCLTLHDVQSQSSDQSLKFHGIKILVDDLDEARAFYKGKLGFMAAPAESREQIVFNQEQFPIYLQKCQFANPGRHQVESRVGLSIQTNKLLPRMKTLQSRDVRFDEYQLRRNGVGISIPHFDPSGNRLSLIEVQIREVPEFDEPRVYNCGVTIANMEAARRFYVEQLGFDIWSTAYLPAALPLKHTDGSFAFMIHYEADLTPNSTKYPDEAQLIIILQINNLSDLIKQLEEKNMPYQRLSKAGILVRDPEGNLIEIIERA